MLSQRPLAVAVPTACLVAAIAAFSGAAPAPGAAAFDPVPGPAAASAPAPGPAAAAAERPVRPLDPETLFAEDARERAPGAVSWSPDGATLAYVYPGDDGIETLWLWRPAAGEPPRAALRPADLGEEGDELPRGVEPVWLPAGDGLVLVHDGDLHLLRPGREPRLTRLTATEEEESDPQPSPDGARLAFVRDHDLWLLDLAAAEAAAGGLEDAGDDAERRLTTGGEEDVTLNAETDWVYWEEIWGRDAEAYWWSPDGGRIAYYRFDETPVASYPLVDFLPVYPEVEWQKYPKAGTANPVVRVGVLDLASGETVWLETGYAEVDGEPEDPYLARVHWRPDGARVAVHRLNREQDRLDLLLCDPAGGSCAVPLTERWPTWVNVEKDFAFLADGGFVWGSERTGWRHLYRYDAAGELVRPLTAGEWAVTGLGGIDEERGRAIVTAYAEGEPGARGRRVLAVPLDGGEPVALAAGPGWNDAEPAPAGGLWVHSWSDADTPTRRTVRGPDGAALGELPAEPPPFDLAALPEWRFLTIPGPQGSRLPAMLLEPATAGAGGESEGAGDGGAARHPVIQFHYGGPGSQMVADRWNPTAGLWHKMMATRGYGVLVVDNLASAYFGKRGEDRQHRRFGPVNLAAQRAGVDYLKTLPWADAARVGLWGWSGGGANTLYCLFGSPGTWRAGMSGAPVTDWRLYDTIWTERYLDHPDDNPEGYAQSSPVTHAADLSDALLVVHGTGDDNVHPQNTIALSDALIKAGRPFEQAIYPKQKHGFRGESQRHFYRRMTEFFDRELGLARGTEGP